LRCDIGYDSIGGVNGLSVDEVEWEAKVCRRVCRQVHIANRSITNGGVVDMIEKLHPHQYTVPYGRPRGISRLT